MNFIDFRLRGNDTGAKSGDETCFVITEANLSCTKCNDKCIYLATEVINDLRPSTLLSI